MKWLLSSAVLLALGMVAAGVVAGRTLRLRDAAVREGVLLRAAHQLERELRESGPEPAANILASFLENDTASAVELRTGETVIASAGAPHGSPIETPMFLGPAWRGLAEAWAIADNHPSASASGPPPHR
jgi:hypothetical protein